MDTITVEQLDKAKDIDITEELQSRVQAAGEEAFPDDEGVTYTLNRAMNYNGLRLVTITPDQYIGYNQLIFELNQDNSINKCYAFDDEKTYFLLFD